MTIRTLIWNLLPFFKSNPQLTKFTKNKKKVIIKNNEAIFYFNGEELFRFSEQVDKVKFLCFLLYDGSREVAMLCKIIEFILSGLERK